MAEVTIDNGRGAAIVVEGSDEGLEITIEQHELGESWGIVLTPDQADDVRTAIDKINYDLRSTRRGGLMAKTRFIQVVLKSESTLPAEELIAPNVGEAEVVFIEEKDHPHDLIRPGRHPAIYEEEWAWR